MNNIIIGTAGHIDHGKTTLIEKLTGINTDFLKEEKERGISIDIGFTYLDLPSGKRVGIIDVPGHEKFIKNMMSGANGINLALIIIDINSGIMPQTIEHINILTHLGINKAIIVLTKVSKCNSDLLDKNKNKIKEYLKTTIYKDAPIVLVDSITGYGINELLSTIDKIIKDKEVNIESIYSTINIDRSFSIKGYGTVVTGTLKNNIIRINDNIKIYPQEVELKIKNIQVHGENTKIAYPGQRVALNINGLSSENIKRGDILSTNKSLKKTNKINIKIALVENRSIKHWDRLRLFYGTDECFCRISIPGKATLNNCKEEFVQLRLEKDVYCDINDKIILRSFSPITTVAGGIIVDTNPGKINRVDYNTQLLYESIIEKDYKKYIDLLIGLNKKILITNVETLFNRKINYIPNNTIKIGEYIYNQTYLNNLLNEFEKYVIDSINNQPSMIGIPKENIKDRFKLNNDLFEYLLEISKNIRIDKSLVIPKKGDVNLNNQEKAIFNNMLEDINKTSFNSFIKYSDLIKSNIHKNIYKIILNKNLAMELNDGYIVSINVFEDAKDLLIKYLNINKKIDVKAYKNILENGRKNAIILLETFDKLKITKRLENDRILY